VRDPGKAPVSLGFSFARVITKEREQVASARETLDTHRFSQSGTSPIIFLNQSFVAFSQSISPIFSPALLRFHLAYFLWYCPTYPLCLYQDIITKVNIVVQEKPESKMEK
jgi:hypothetical protein